MNDNLAGETAGAMLMAALVQTGISVALHRWGRWVAARHHGRWWRRMAWAPLVALVMSLAGITITVVLLFRTFGALAGVDASMKATILAQGISQAMNATALLAVPAYALYLASLITFVAGSLKAAEGY